MTRKGKGTEKEAAFVPALPAKLRTRSGKSRKRGNQCMRSAAETPPNPESEPSLAQNKAKLEQAFGLQLETKNGKSGKCACIWCNGARERRCSWCDGRGFRYELGHASWEQMSADIERMSNEAEPQPMRLPERVPVRCSACSGSRKLRCAYCRGSGVGSYGHAHQ